MIQIKSLTKYYGDLEALSQLSFSARTGEVVGLLGLNGAGKTTCLRILAGYLMPSSGSCSIDNVDVFSRSMEVRARIGYLPESPPLYPELSVEDYLNFVARMRGVIEENLSKEFNNVAKITHLENLQRTRIKNLSLGYRKKGRFSTSFNRFTFSFNFRRTYIRFGSCSNN